MTTTPLRTPPDTTPTGPTEMVLASGRYYDPASPMRYPLELSDIAWQLARINRFAGARTYSVAQHSILVADICQIHAVRLGWHERAVRRAYVMGLLHDAHEAITGDMPRPVQAALSPGARSAWARLQQGVQVAIHAHLRVMPPDSAEQSLVSTADLMALYLERRRFWAHDAREWPAFGKIKSLIEAYGTADYPTIEQLDPQEAELAFLTQARARGVSG